MFALVPFIIIYDDLVFEHPLYIKIKFVYIRSTDIWRTSCVFEFMEIIPICSGHPHGTMERPMNARYGRW